MAENNTKKIYILTFDGEYITNDKDVVIAPDEIICYIDATGYSEEEIEEMKEAIAAVDWRTFCATCECNTSSFTVAEVTEFVNIMEDWYILLPHIHSLYDLGEFIFDNRYDFEEYADLRKYIDFKSVGHDMVESGEAAKTSYGLLIAIW